MGTLYDITKLLHLLCVILWIGPPLGAYYFLFRAYRDADVGRILWAERCCERVLLVEHIAFLIMLLSGLFMFWIGPWTLPGTPWLEKKLFFVGGIIVFECFDVWLAHVVFARLLRGESPLDGADWPAAVRARNRLIIAAIPMASLLIPGALVFALLKY